MSAPRAVTECRQIHTEQKGERNTERGSEKGRERLASRRRRLMPAASPTENLHLLKLRTHKTFSSQLIFGTHSTLPFHRKLPGVIHFLQRTWKKIATFAKHQSTTARPCQPLSAPTPELDGPNSGIENSPRNWISLGRHRGWGRKVGWGGEPEPEPGEIQRKTHQRPAGINQTVQLCQSSRCDVAKSRFRQFARMHHLCCRRGCCRVQWGLHRFTFEYTYYLCVRGFRMVLEVSFRRWNFPGYKEAKLFVEYLIVTSEVVRWNFRVLRYV